MAHIEHVLQQGEGIHGQIPEGVLHEPARLLQHRHQGQGHRRGGGRLAGEHEQQALQRRAEVAQQMANLSAERSAQAASLALHRRERAQLQAALQQAEADVARTQRLAEAGFVAPAALEQAQRQQALAQRLLQQAEQDHALEAQTRAQALAELGQAVAGLQAGLQGLATARERLAPRATMAGQLSGWQLQEGMQLRAGQRLGRIDDPTGGLQLVADVDEFHLPRLQPGLAATSAQGALTLAQTLPQVRGGLVRVQLRWPEGGVEERLFLPGSYRIGSGERCEIMLPDHHTTQIRRVAVRRERRRRSAGEPSA
jgi:hypothetical protein